MEVWLKNLYRAFLKDPSVKFEDPIIFESHLFIDKYWRKRSQDLAFVIDPSSVSLKTIINPKPEMLIGLHEHTAVKLLSMRGIGYSYFIGYDKRPETSLRNRINFRVNCGIVVEAWWDDGN